MRINREVSIRHETVNTPNIDTVSSIVRSDDQFICCATSITSVGVPSGSKGISPNIVDKHSNRLIVQVSALRDGATIAWGAAEINSVHRFTVLQYPWNIKVNDAIYLYLTGDNLYRTLS